MQKYDKFFIGILLLSSAMLIGVMMENLQFILNPPSAILKIDVDKVKAEIKQAGLEPLEAKYWKIIKNERSETPRPLK